MAPATKKRAVTSPKKDEEERAASPSLGDKPKAMASIFDAPPPEPMRKLRVDKGGGATSLSKLQGVVTRVKEESVQGPKGMIPKIRIDLIVTGVITNGAQDVIQTGIPGEVFYVPSRQIDTPETAENGDGKFKLKSRELVIDEYSKLRKVSTASMSFYKESKDGGATGVNACAPGMTVEVSGVCVNQATGKSGMPGLYLNGGKVTCTMSEAPNPGALPAHMMELCKTETMQKWGAFACSLPAKGFFTAKGLTQTQQNQADACQELWQRAISGAADRLAVMSNGKEEKLANMLENHEQRIRAISPAQLACGDTCLFLYDSRDCTIAPIVNEGITPWNKAPAAYNALLAGGDEADALPQMFAMPFTWQVEIAGNGVSMEARVMYCFDKDAVLDAKEKGDANSMLATERSAICMNLSMKDMAVKFGNNHAEKLKFAVKQVLPMADFAAFPKVSHIESTSAGDSVSSDFPEGGTIYLNMPSTLQKVGILVPADLIKDHMCEGNSQYVPDADPTSERFSFPDNVKDLPTYANYRYQELTYGTASGTGGFKFSNFKPLPGKSIEYRVIYDGCIANIASNKELVTDAASGKSHIETVAQMATDQGMDVKDFLTQRCLVYAIMA
tara:strand:+ start:1639 stop:3486 length:1848 start_codon:yes stop_codon:yes gene_type:complete